jgi:hypothetical protein
MKFMVLVKADKNSEAGVMPDEKLLAEMTTYNEELVKAGVMRAGEGLHPSSAGARVQFDGASRSVTKGPFPGDPSNLVAGFWIWECKSLDEAIEWARRCPNPMQGKSELEIRRVFADEDFGDALTPDIKEREARMRAQVEQR